MNPQSQAMLQDAIQDFQDGKFDEAKLILMGLLQADSNNNNVIFELAFAYVKANRFIEALDIFDCLQGYQKNDLRIPYNRGLIYALQGEHRLAIESYDLALKIKADDVETLINKGASCNDIKNYAHALEVLEYAISVRPDIPEAWTNMAIALKNLNLHEESVNAYQEAMHLQPDLDWVYGDFFEASMKICMWTDFQSHLKYVVNKVLTGDRVTRPLGLLALNDDAQLHQKSSEIYIQASYPLNPGLGPISKHPKNERIRIAYFSSDFRSHPVAFLIAELLEIHDRSRFEIYAFSLVKATDEMRDRFVRTVDHFIDVETKSAIEIALLARNLAIDIAVDLTGFTRDSKTEIFAYRAAPIQVNYLGYPSTMGADYMDYIIADQTLIPVHSQPFYSEKVAYLPHSYQVNDRKRSIADTQFTRQELGLPDQGFVFCCFNNNFKILPASFDGWMRILKAVKGSILWLFEDNPWAIQNLKKEAQKRGIDANRLVFAERIPLAEHLARHRLADLFLDTFPYNAHTTASDALWAGLPLVTLIGESFASRVAASLLSAIGLPELITKTQAEYEALAIELAIDPMKLLGIKEKLATNRLTTPLFDTPLFTKDIEAAYIEMHERYHAGLEPDHIAIA